MSENTIMPSRPIYRSGYLKRRYLMLLRQWAIIPATCGAGKKALIKALREIMEQEVKK